MRRAALAALLIAIGTAVAACVGSTTSSGAGNAFKQASVGSGGGRAPEAAAGSSGAATTEGSAAPPSTPITIGDAGGQIERSVTAAYLVPAGTFLTSFDGVTARAVGMGGYVVSSSTNPDGGGRMVSGSATVKVPAVKLADFLNGMPATFTASSIDFASVDHTAAFVDLSARLSSSRAHLAALNGLLTRATSLTDIATVEQEVAAVHAEIDTEQGQLNVVNAAVAMATAAVHLSERGVSPAPPAPVSPVSSAIGNGWSNALQVTGAVIGGVVTVLPLLVLALLAWLAWRGLGGDGPRWKRSRRLPD